jgi:tetratricopeptide (TPR) repeat protein
MIPAIQAHSPHVLENSVPPTSFDRLRMLIEKQDFEGAEIFLESLFAIASSEMEVIQCYEFLFELLPHFESFDYLENNLHHLLQKSPNLTQYQEQLAVNLAKAYLIKGHQIKAMHCFAKALQINRSQENYKAASQVFVGCFQQKERLDAFLINPTLSLDAIDIALEQIQVWKGLGLSTDDLALFYQKILRGINAISLDQQPKYADYRRQIRDQLIQLDTPQFLALEQYWERLQELRKGFSDCSDVRHFQKETTEKFRAYFQLLLNDIFALIGPPPCGYDIRAMGSIGREEMCPYSDLEFMILIADESHKPYFQKLVHVLEVQMASLGAPYRADARRYL